MNLDSMEFVIKAKDLPQGVKIENDRITDLNIRRDRGFILGLDMCFASQRQSLFCGHNNTANLGYMLYALAEILEVNVSGDSPNFLHEFEGTPIRVATDKCWGEIYVDHIWLGHFMEDRWVLANDIVKFGIEQEKK